MCAPHRGSVGLVLSLAGVVEVVSSTILLTPPFDSGRKARRHGRLKVATWVMTNGKLASGFCAPRLAWAEAPVAAKAASTTVFASFIFHLRWILLDANGSCFTVYGSDGAGCEDFGRSTRRKDPPPGS
jgi:hypothetical protein